MTPVSPAADDHDDELVHRVAALERTALAWERTGIGLAGVGALLLHLREESTGMLVLGGILLAAALLVVALAAPARYRAARAGVLASDSVAAPWLLLALAVLVAAVGLGLTTLLLAEASRYRS